MRYKIALYNSEEGYSVSVPGLPGCWSQGKTKDEAIANIETAIGEYLEVVGDLRDRPSTETEGAPASILATREPPLGTCPCTR